MPDDDRAHAKQSDEHLLSASNSDAILEESRLLALPRELRDMIIKVSKIQTYSKRQD